MGSMATSYSVHTSRLHFRERGGKDQRKIQTQMLRVNEPLVMTEMTKNVTSDGKVQPTVIKYFSAGTQCYDIPHIILKVFWLKIYDKCRRTPVKDQKLVTVVPRCFLALDYFPFISEKAHTDKYSIN